MSARERENVRKKNYHSIEKFSVEILPFQLTVSTTISNMPLVVQEQGSFQHILRYVGKQLIKREAFRNTGRGEFNRGVTSEIF